MPVVLMGMARLALIAVLLSGCSIALQTKPTATALNGCSTSSAYWIADAAIATAALAGGGVAYVSTQDTSNTDAGAAVAGVAALASVIYIASAVTGYRARAQCAGAAPTMTATR